MMKKHINLSDAPLFFFNKNRMLKNGSFLRGFAKCFQSFKKISERPNICSVSVFGRKKAVR